MTRPRILLVGGAGVFGRRLAEGLNATVHADVLIAGRSLARAQAAQAELGAHGAVALDRQHATAEQIRTHAPALVIDAAGPFQGADLALARTSIAARCDYLDLAEARDFVSAFPVLDAEARTAGVRALCGASTTPALSHAALDDLTRGWRRIDSIQVGITPGARAPRGASVVEAVLGWAGAPVRVFEEGEWRVRPGWSGTLRRRLPGLGSRRFALAETADLDLLVQRYQLRFDAVFLAGLELGVMHHGLTLLSIAHAKGWIRDLRPLSPLLRWGGDVLAPFGSSRGGMFIEALGRDAADAPVRAEWTLLADQNRGPYVPTLAALALARRLLADRSIPPGARIAMGAPTLAEMQPDFARLGMTTAQRVDDASGAMERALGADLDLAPKVVAASHRSGPVHRMRGEASVAGALSMPARLVARLFGFPPASDPTEVSVTKRVVGPGMEIWTRRMGGSTFRSHLKFFGPGLVEERFGPFDFRLKVAADASGVALTPIGWRLGPLPLPLPLFLAPKSDAREQSDPDGRFHFDVPIALPLLGRLTHYKGWLAPEGAPPASPPERVRVP